MIFDRLPVHPYGIKVSMTWLQIAAHLDAIERYNIGLFIELGVLEGGLASVLLPGVEKGLFEYMGVEINEAIINQSIRDKADILIGNCFRADTKAHIQKVINRQDRPVLLFCDNGDKPREVKEYNGLLRSGDYLAVHDYGIEVTAKDLAILDQGFTEIDGAYRRTVIKMPMFRRL